MDFIKTLRLILDNPANNLNETSKDLIETMISCLEAEKPVKTVTANIVKVQQVIQPFEDDASIIDNQSASIDKDHWLTVTHCGNEFTLNTTNWKKLVTLVHSILPNEKGGY